MLSIEEAQQSVLDEISQLAVEMAPLLQALNRVTSEDHIAPWDIPAADNSAMDGFAFAAAGVKGNRLKVTGFLPAGEVHELDVACGETVKIMTGAPIPSGCDTVVPIEDVEEEGGFITLKGAVKTGAHVRRHGEDIALGDIVIPAGSLLRPQEIGMLCAMGRTAVAVYRRARVAILATGDELLEPGSTPVPGKLIDCNSTSLAAQVIEAGGEPVLLGISPDTMEDTCDRIQAGTAYDMLVISGGVSVGDRDYVKAAIEALGGSVTFWKVNMKPGKPLAFGKLRQKPVFALPGNPVAAMVSFELFVRPAILKAMGHGKILRPTVAATLEGPAANKGNRPHLMRGIVSKREGRYFVSTTGNQSSGRLSSLVLGNALMKLQPEVTLPVGAQVPVMLLDTAFEMETCG